MIARGELGAVNMGAAQCGKSRFVILPTHIDEYARRHQAATVATTRNKRKAAIPDYLGDVGRAAGI